MSVDGFSMSDAAPYQAFDHRRATNFYRRVLSLGRLFGVEVVGIEKIPAEKALFVANHTFGWDIVFAMAEVWRVRNRVWALGEHAWWRVPYLRKLAAAVGTVDGTPENLDLLLTANEPVFVLPGGLREAVKPRELRYRLLWGHRYGFVRAAIRNQAPVVPVAAIGADDFFDFMGNAYTRGERWLRRQGIPIPLPARILPIPHLTKLRFVFGDAIRPPPSRFEQDATVLKRFRHEIEGALYELIEVELARRAGIPSE